jgi:hypothetical protein
VDVAGLAEWESGRAVRLLPESEQLGARRVRWFLCWVVVRCARARLVSYGGADVAAFPVGLCSLPSHPPLRRLSRAPEPGANPGRPHAQNERNSPVRPRLFLRRSMRAAAGLERARWASTLWSFCDALSARSSIYACRACNTGMALTAMWSQVPWRPVQPSRGALQEIACREPYRAKSTVRII